MPGAIADVGPLEIRPGGSVANTGTDLAELGADVLLVADLGDDELGAAVLRALLPAGADCGGIRQIPGMSTSYSLVFELPGTDRSSGTTWEPTLASTGVACSPRAWTSCISATRRCCR